MSYTWRGMLPSSALRNLLCSTPEIGNTTCSTSKCYLAGDKTVLVKFFCFVVAVFFENWCSTELLRAEVSECKVEKARNTAFKSVTNAQLLPPTSYHILITWLWSNPSFKLAQLILTIFLTVLESSRGLANDWVFHVPFHTYALYHMTCYIRLGQLAIKTTVYNTVKQQILTETERN